MLRSTPRPMARMLLSWATRWWRSAIKKALSSSKPKITCSDIITTTRYLWYHAAAPLSKASTAFLTSTFFRAFTCGNPAYQILALCGSRLCRPAFFALALCIPYWHANHTAFSLLPSLHALACFSCLIPLSSSRFTLKGLPFDPSGLLYGFILRISRGAYNLNFLPLFCLATCCVLYLYASQFLTTFIIGIVLSHFCSYF